ncbi:MAG: 4-hydroxy-3-methylbut-2-enyl diphosphate reductase [Kiritimatiellae bacterium]|nr:4-hydroxy-3-methylbut-2-enyl diphosphate reductase [Kiritimatiellia bacterium]
MQVEVLEPHGFCAGVTAALRKALALVRDGAADTVYCLHELVHNEIVVGDLTRRGFKFVESVADIPEGATALFSAHGVSPAVRRAAAARRLKVMDATCPFVTRVHTAARDFAARGLPVVVIGHENHAEVKGIVGEVSDVAGHSPAITANSPTLSTALGGAQTIGVVSQTTMNADEVAALVAQLKERFAVETMAEVCNATKERQDAVKAFDGDALLVLGSANSSNTRRLMEVARCRAFRAGTLEEVRALDLRGVRRLGVTSGASTPESFLAEAVAYLKEDGK